MAESAPLHSISSFPEGVLKITVWSVKWRNFTVIYFQSDQTGHALSGAVKVQNVHDRKRQLFLSKLQDQPECTQNETPPDNNLIHMTANVSDERESIA